MLFKNTIVNVLLALGLVMVGAIFAASLLREAQTALASTPRFAEYQSTTTSAGIFTAESLVQTGPGTLGSIVITGSAAGVITIYDATTSNVNLRTGNVASSSLLRAATALSVAAGTYTFDSLLTTGLLVEVTGTMPTSTITYRPN